jgi:hypothetical protein
LVAQAFLPVFGVAELIDRRTARHRQECLCHRRLVSVMPVVPKKSWFALRAFSKSAQRGQ